MKIENDELLLDFYKNRMITYSENWKEYIQDNYKNGLKMVTSNKKTTIK